MAIPENIQEDILINKKKEIGRLTTNKFSFDCT